VPTYERLRRFDRDYDGLWGDEKEAFKAAIRNFVEDLERGKGFRKALRVKGVQGSPGLSEVTWAEDGRATFSYGDSIRQGEPHVIWRRAGGHEIFR
jgi:hypothetical protein